MSLFYKDQTPGEKYAEKWLADHGFEITKVKQWQSETRIDVRKDGVDDFVELFVDDKAHACKKRMEWFGKTFEDKKETERLRKLVAKMKEQNGYE